MFVNFKLFTFGVNSSETFHAYYFHMDLRTRSTISCSLYHLSLIGAQIKLQNMDNITFFLCDQLI